MSTTTIEMVSYRLKNTASIDDLRVIHAAVNAFCLSQAGFLYRSVSQDENQWWFDVVYWRNMEDAKAAGKAFMHSGAGQALSAVIEQQSVKMRHMLADAEAYSALLALYAGTQRQMPYTASAQTK